MLNLQPDTDRKLAILDAALSYAYSNADDAFDALDIHNVVTPEYAEQVIENLRHQIHDIQDKRAQAQREQAESKK